MHISQVTDVSILKKKVTDVLTYFLIIGINGQLAYKVAFSLRFRHSSLST